MTHIIGYINTDLTTACVVSEHVSNITFVSNYRMINCTDDITPSLRLNTLHAAHPVLQPPAPDRY